MGSQRGPSMRDFDYFDDDAKPVEPGSMPPDKMPVGLEEHLRLYHRRRRRARRAVFWSAAFFAVAAWFVWGYRDGIVYAFRDPAPPTKMGPVTELHPSELQHNTYVEISGITEHRGLRQKVVRGLGIERREFWYMRLVGSRGVFLELPPDKDKYGFTTRLTVQGRVVDPERADVYATLLETYRDRYFTRKRPQQRVVQVGYAPGSGRKPFFVMFSVLAAIAAFNLYNLVHWLRIRRQAPIAGGGA